jgi:hypothetical protein
MLAVKKWAHEKNNLIALFAPQTAAMAWMAPESLRHIRERCISGYKFPLPDYSCWFAMYRSPAKSVRAYIKFISG